MNTIAENIISAVSMGSPKPHPSDKLGRVQGKQEIGQSRIKSTLPTLTLSSLNEFFRVPVLSSVTISMCWIHFDKSPVESSFPIGGRALDAGDSLRSGFQR